MNPAQLLTHFDRLADAPDAIPRLRRFILDLAVRGKLVPQDPNDEPAAELLRRIREEKARRVKDGIIKPRDTQRHLTNENLRFDVPANWAWTRLGEIGEWGSGSTPSRGVAEFFGGGIPWLKSGELNDNESLVGSDETVTPLALAKHTFRRNGPGDILFAMYGATIGKVAILAEAAVTNQAVVGCTPFEGIFNRYLYKFLVSQRARFHAASEGGAQPNVSKEKVIRCPFPLPPLAEQRRIVAKVDELMALCDRLEAAQAEREARRERLVRASLGRLNEPAADAATFRDQARFHVQHLPRTATRPEHIAPLRQTLLNLAVRGKLVPQDPKDEPVTDLLTRVHLTKPLNPKARVTASSSYDAVSENEVPFLDIPRAWQWVRAADLCLCVVSGSTPPQQILSANAGVPFLKVYNIRDQRIDFEYKPQFIERSYHSSKSKRSILFPGDVVMNIVGPPLGKVAIVPSEFSEWNCNQAITAFRPAIPELADYLYTFFREGSFLRKIELVGTAGQDNISVNKCRNIPVPLPPLAEQHRIVAKVDELMAVCDRLEAQLAATHAESRRLLDAVLHEALAEA